MVTASHNPPQDNGYKVYLGDGSQIVPPADAEIAARIAAVGALADVPARRRRRGRSTSEIVDRYLDTVAELAGDGPRDLDIVYTPLHGVGGTSVVAGPRDRRLRRAARGRASRSSPTRTSRPWPSPTRRSRARWTSRWRSRPRRRRRPRGRQRPRRRPLRRRRPRPARLADAARRRGRRAARRTTCSRRGKQGTYADLDRLLVAARQDGGRRRPAVRRDADRLQVDRPGRRGWRSATRRRSATASTPSTCRTRTASRRCCCSASWPPRPRPRAAP